MIEVKLLILAILSDVKNHWNVYILGVILLGLFTVAPMLMLVYLRPSVVPILGIACIVMNIVGWILISISMVISILERKSKLAYAKLYKK